MTARLWKKFKRRFSRRRRKFGKKKKRRVKPHFQTTKNIPTLGLNIRCKWMIWVLTSRLNRTKDSFIPIMRWCRKWLRQPHIHQRKLKKFGEISISTKPMSIWKSASLRMKRIMPFMKSGKVTRRIGKISAIHMMIGTKQATVIFSFTNAVSNVFRKCMTAVL